MADESKPPETKDNTGEGDPQQPRLSLLHIALEILVPALFMGGIWITGNWKDQYPLATVFALAVGAYAATWWAGRRFKTPYPTRDLVTILAPQLLILAVVGQIVLSSRFPELTLDPLLTAAALAVVAILANEVTSVVGFADFAVMLVLGFVVPQIAFTLGFPSGPFGKFVLSVLVLVPLGAFVFNQGIDEDVGARTLAPMIGLGLSYMFGTPEPRFDISTSLIVLGFLIVVRVLVKIQWWAAGHMRAASFLLWTSTGLMFVDFDAVQRALPPPLIDW